MDTASTPERRITLQFADAPKRKKLVHNVSALASVGRTLFCASDEHAAIERLVLSPDGSRFEGHSRILLDDVVDLPEGRDREVDVEGLVIADGHLWATGSHATVRKTTGDEPGWYANRGLLCRLPLLHRGDGVVDLETRRDKGAAAVRLAKRSDAVRDLLLGEPWLRPFHKLASKENGLDVEGIAVSGDRLFLGLRGPVVAKQAILAELRVEVSKSGRLKARKLDGDRRVRLHTIDLQGLGIRGMTIDREQILILAGATMAVTGPQAVYVLGRVPDRPSRLDATRVLDLPVAIGSDKGEGLTVLDHAGRRRLLVAYDSPRPGRADPAAGRLEVDTFPWE